MVGSNPFFAIRQILLMQGFVVVFGSSIILAVFGLQAAKSALYGGLIGFLPNAYFAYGLSKSRGMTADKILRSFYVSESKKLIFTAILFILVFQLPGILFLPLFIGFVAVIVVFWFALLIRSTF